MHVRSEISIGERSETSSLLACRKGWLSLRTAAVDWPRLTALVSALPGLRFRRCEDFAEQGEDFRDAEGLLQQGGFPSGRSFRPGIAQVAAHVDDSGLRRTGGGEDLRGSFAAVDKKAARGEMHVAEKNVVRAAPRIATRRLSLMRRARALGLVSSRLAIRGKALKERECFFDGGGAVHAEPLRGEAFVQQLAQAFFVVEDENAAAFEIGRASCRERGWKWVDGGALKSTR